MIIRFHETQKQVRWTLESRVWMKRLMKPFTSYSWAFREAIREAIRAIHEAHSMVRRRIKIDRQCWSAFAEHRFPVWPRLRITAITCNHLHKLECEHEDQKEKALWWRWTSDASWPVEISTLLNPHEDSNLRDQAAICQVAFGWKLLSYASPRPKCPSDGLFKAFNRFIHGIQESHLKTRDSRILELKMRMFSCSNLEPL